MTGSNVFRRRRMSAMGHLLSHKQNNLAILFVGFAHPLFNIALREGLFLTQFAEAVANNHGGIIPSRKLRRQASARRGWLFLQPAIRGVPGEVRGSRIW